MMTNDEGRMESGALQIEAGALLDIRHSPFAIRRGGLAILLSHEPDTFRRRPSLAYTPLIAQRGGVSRI